MLIGDPKSSLRVRFLPQCLSLYLRHQNTVSFPPRLQNVRDLVHQECLLRANQDQSVF